MTTPFLVISDGDEGAHVVVEAAQDLLAPAELGHVRAEAMEDRRELACDVAAADDDQPLGKARQVEDLVRADRELGARHFRRNRPASGGDDDVRGAMANAVDLDFVRADELGPAADHGRSGAFEQLAVDAVEAADLRGAARLQGRPVEARRADAPAEAACLGEALGVMRGEAVQLLRNAAEVDAGAAERRVLGDGDARAALGGQASGANAGAAGADDEEVVLEGVGLAHARVATLTS